MDGVFPDFEVIFEDGTPQLENESTLFKRSPAVHDDDDQEIFISLLLRYWQPI